MTTQHHNNLVSEDGVKPPAGWKELYDQCCQQHRFFLNWRHAILAGHLAVMAALGVAVRWAYDDEHGAFELTWVICFLGAMLTIFFWQLDDRTRTLFTACEGVGDYLERKLGFEQGVFIQLWLQNTYRERFRLDALKTHETTDETTPGTSSSAYHASNGSAQVKSKWFQTGHGRSINIYCAVTTVLWLVVGFWFLYLFIKFR
jgi:hypothetical protein